jgi:hypothetical protein
MVTLIWESPAYIFSSKQFPESRVISVICHHSLAQRGWLSPTDGMADGQAYKHVGLQPAGLVLLGPCLSPDAHPSMPNASAHLLLEAGATQERTLKAVSSWPWFGGPSSLLPRPSLLNLSRPDCPTPQLLQRALACASRLFIIVVQPEQEIPKEG